MISSHSTPPYSLDLRMLSELDENGFGRAQLDPVAQHDALLHQATARPHILRLVALPRPRKTRHVVRMPDDKSADGGAAAPERIDIALYVRARLGREVKVDVHRRAVSGTADQPRVQIDEGRANEAIVLEHGVPGDVGIVDGQLHDLGRPGPAYGRVDDESGIIAWLDVRRGGRIERGAIDCRAVQRDGLDLMPHEERVYQNSCKELTKLYL